MCGESLRKVGRALLSAAVLSSFATSFPVYAQQRPIEAEFKNRIRSLLEVPTKKASFVVPSALVESPEFAKLDGKLRSEMLVLYGASLALLQSEAPEGRDHAFEWKGDRTKLEKKKLLILLTTSEDPTVLPETGGPGENPDVDSLTLQMMQRDSSMVVVCLMVDRLMYENGKVRPDEFPRVAVALAHAMFGDVPNELNMDVEQLKNLTEDKHLDMKRDAYRASLDFIGRIRGSKVLEKLDKERRDRITAQFDHLKKVEQERLDKLGR